MKELLEKYFKEALTEDITKEIDTLFETSVNEKVNEKLVTKEKDLDEKNVVELETFKNELVEKLDEYCSVAVEEFIENEAEKINKSIKSEITEKAIKSLHDVLVGSNVDIPETEVELMKELEEKIKSANEMIERSLSEKNEAVKQNFEYEKAIKFGEITETLSEVKKENVLNLIEGLVYTDISDFEDKVKIVIENVGEGKQKTKKTLIENFDHEVDVFLP